MTISDLIERLEAMREIKGGDIETNVAIVYFDDGEVVVYTEEMA